MTDPHNSYDSEDKYIEYLDRHPYENPLERDFWSDRATRIVRFVIGGLLLIFTIVWMFIRFQL